MQTFVSFFIVFWFQPAIASACTGDLTLLVLYSFRNLWLGLVLIVAWYYIRGGRKWCRTFLVTLVVTGIALGSLTFHTWRADVEKNAWIQQCLDEGNDGCFPMC